MVSGIGKNIENGIKAVIITAIIFGIIFGVAISIGISQCSKYEIKIEKKEK